jgi:hypothetical protein
MIKHGEHTIIVQPVASGFTTSPEYRIAYFAEAARIHPAASSSRFRRRVWRDDQSLGDRIHAATAARRLSTVADAQLDQALADLRDGVTP